MAIIHFYGDLAVIQRQLSNMFEVICGRIGPGRTENTLNAAK